MDRYRTLRWITVNAIRLSVKYGYALSYFFWLWILCDNFQSLQYDIGGIFLGLMTLTTPLMAVYFYTATKEVEETGIFEHIIENGWF